MSYPHSHRQSYAQTTMRIDKAFWLYLLHMSETTNQSIYEYLQAVTGYKPSLPLVQSAETPDLLAVSGNGTQPCPGERPNTSMSGRPEVSEGRQEQP